MTTNQSKSHRAGMGVGGAALAAAIILVALAALGLRPQSIGATAQPAADTTRPTIIFIVVDSLRADHVASYGYDRPTTPNLDAFMESGVRFAEATSVSPWTFPSNAATMTGRLPSRLAVRDWASVNERVAADENMLAEYLRDAGYQTAGFNSAFFVRPQFGFNQGFDVYQNVANPNVAENVNREAFNWLDANRSPDNESPLFLFLYYYDPHTWYDPPPPYDTLYDPDYTGSLTAEVYQHGVDVITGAIVPTERDIQHLIALYDGEINYWDYHLGQLFATLSSKGLLENALVIVTADHGQMFGEHDKWVHRNSLYEEVLRVPFFMHYSGNWSPTVIDTPVSHLDILPTVLDVVGVPIPDGLDGHSLVPLLEGEAEALTGRAIYAEMHAQVDPESLGYVYAPRHELRSVKLDGWKYILEFNNPAGDQFFWVQPESLYERVNEIETYPELAGSYNNLLYDWFRLPTEFLYLPSIQRE